MTTNRIQYWKNGIMLTTVTKPEAEKIMMQALEAGYKVYDNDSYFSVITEILAG